MQLVLRINQRYQFVDIQQYAVRRKVIENKRFQLEQAQMDKLTVNTLGDAQ